jgi:hypothetical protein
MFNPIATLKSLVEFLGASSAHSEALIVSLNAKFDTFMESHLTGTVRSLSEALAHEDRARLGLALHDLHKSSEYYTNIFQSSLEKLFFSGYFSMSNMEVTKEAATLVLNSAKHGVALIPIAFADMFTLVRFKLADKFIAWSDWKLLVLSAKEKAKLDEHLLLMTSIHNYRISEIGKSVCYRCLGYGEGEINECRLKARDAGQIDWDLWERTTASNPRSLQVGGILSAFVAVMAAREGLLPTRLKSIHDDTYDALFGKPRGLSCEIWKRCIGEKSDFVNNKQLLKEKEDRASFLADQSVPFSFSEYVFCFNDSLYVFPVGPFRDLEKGYLRPRFRAITELYFDFIFLENVLARSESDGLFPELGFECGFPHGLLENKPQPRT